MVASSGHVCRLLRSALLTTRGHIDLLRVTSAVCRRGLAPPGRTAQIAEGLICDGSLVSAMGTGLQRVAAGLLLGTLVGAGLALASGLFRIGEDLVDAPVQMRTPS